MGSVPVLSADIVCIADRGELLAAIGHLYKAMDLLTYVNNTIIDQIMDGLEMVEKLSEGWMEVNRCRIYTENIQALEEKLIPGMGLIYDAKAMMESLIAWKLGMTLNAKFHIISCIREAAFDCINPILSELEFCLEEQLSEPVIQIVPLSPLTDATVPENQGGI